MDKFKKKSLIKRLGMEAEVKYFKDFNSGLERGIIDVLNSYNGTKEFNIEGIKLNKNLKLPLGGYNITNKIVLFKAGIINLEKAISIF